MGLEKAAFVVRVEGWVVESLVILEILYCFVPLDLYRQHNT